MVVTPERYKQIAKNYLNSKNLREFTDDDIFVVWYSKTLQNSKALLGIHDDDRYLEMTYNGDKKEMYIDTYIKQQNEVINV